MQTRNAFVTAPTCTVPHVLGIRMALVHVEGQAGAHDHEQDGWNHVEEADDNLHGWKGRREGGCMDE